MDYQQPDLSVITVNYNGFHDTCEFIDSWAAPVFLSLIHISEPTRH